ncbi:hypothetical protein VKT23_017223 [Stygiomarasmius scandens]|uniref:Uncharacterized protein n=1 Tax=Marasmiellus scandens TaxID=2682957 RepID=A0ABR1ISZ6_9AGAR
MAPPCGVFAANYSRHIHYEQQLHKWGIAWTTHQIPNRLGGSFYYSVYGIHIRPATNTVHRWEPSLWHGTALPDTEPDPSFEFPEVVQSGHSFVTSNQIGIMFQRFIERQISIDELEEDFLRLAAVGEDTEEEDIEDGKVE